VCRCYGDTKENNPMYDLAIPAEAPGKCPKCRGSGQYAWGGTVNGKPVKTGTCFSCRGTGQQDRSQIGRNHAYNRFKIAQIVAEG
jgi:DnaJ-class molecular chaperone